MGQTAAVHLNGNKFDRLSDKITSRRWEKTKTAPDWWIRGPKTLQAAVRCGAVRWGKTRATTSAVRAAGCGRSKAGLEPRSNICNIWLSYGDSTT